MCITYRICPGSYCVYAIAIAEVNDIAIFKLNIRHRVYSSETLACVTLRMTCIAIL